MDETNVIAHDFKELPFIPFRNNAIGTTDLEVVKELVDCYDKVYSGFINHLDDIQELIFILAGYEDEPLETFLKKQMARIFHLGSGEKRKTG